MKIAQDLLLMQLINIICSIIGFIFFIMSFFRINEVLKMLKTAKIAKQWHYARILVVFFSLGYLINIPLVFIIDLNLLLLMQGTVYLFGALFVLIVFSISRKTYQIIYQTAEEG